jgi:amidase
MTFKEYDQYDAIGLSQLIAGREVSVQEVVNAAVERIEKRNPKVNAVVTSMVERWAADFKLADKGSALYGVPFMLKDLIAAYKGVPLSFGCRALQDNIPDYDSEIVKRFKDAGLVTLAKTNTPEFGLMGITEPDLFGPTRNPWNLDHTSGGSSGGSAAAVASRMVPIASAGDGGGSIRIPASCCGVFGLKPSRGRTPTGPDQGQLWQGAAVEHVLSRSVRDSALILDLIAGADVGAYSPVVKPDYSYLDLLDKPTRKLRIAFSVRNPTGAKVSAECLAAIDKTVKVLQELGHEVEEATPKYDADQLYKSYLAMNLGETAAAIGHLETQLQRPLKPGKDIEPMTAFLAQLGNSYSAKEFAHSLHLWNDYARAMGAFHKKYDLYLTPALADEPAKIGELAPSAVEQQVMRMIHHLPVAGVIKKAGIFEALAMRQLERLPFTQLANLTGQPAMSLPVHWSAKGLPIGVQFVAAMGDEATLFQLANQLEDVFKWQDKAPEWLN